MDGQTDGTIKVFKEKLEKQKTAGDGT